MLKIIFVFTLFSLSAAHASRQQYFDVVGKSPKGQFIALEEYGYRADRQIYYVTIKVMNVWKNTYVGSPVLVEVPAKSPLDLTKAREKAKMIAQEELQKFQVM